MSTFVAGGMGEGQEDPGRLNVQCRFCAGHNVALNHGDGNGIVLYAAMLVDDGLLPAHARLGPEDRRGALVLPPRPLYQPRHDLLECAVDVVQRDVSEIVVHKFLDVRKILWVRQDRRRRLLRRRLIDLILVIVLPSLLPVTLVNAGARSSDQTAKSKQRFRFAGDSDSRTASVSSRREKGQPIDAGASVFPFDVVFG